MPQKRDILGARGDIGSPQTKYVKEEIILSLIFSEAMVFANI